MNTQELAKTALRAYRHGLRAADVAFKGDSRMLVAARAKMRQGMECPPGDLKDLSPEGKVQLLEDVALYLRRNVVQGKKVAVDPVTGQPRYHLNITKDTELGDNDSLKMKTNLKAKSFKQHKPCH